MKILNDGSVVSNGASTPISYKNGKPYDEQYGLLRCRIVETLYIDDPKNSTRNSGYPQIEYTCLVLDGPSQGQLLRGVVDSTYCGGSKNYSEIVRVSDSNFQPSQTSQKDYRKGDGDFVLVANIQGQINTPTIVSDYKHPQSASTATSNNGVFSRTVKNNVVQEINKDGNYKVTNAGSESLLDNVVNQVASPVDSATLSETVNDINGSIDGIIAKYAAVPDIDLTDEINTLTGMKDSLGSVVSDPTTSLESLTDMASGLSAFKDAPVNIGQLKDLSSTVGTLGSIVGFSKPISIQLSSGGEASMGNELQKMKVDKMGQAAIESIGGAGQKFAIGGVGTVVSPFINMNAASAFNVNSLLTRIGKTGLPTSRIGDVSVGSNSAGPVVSKIVSGSYISMIGS